MKNNLKKISKVFLIVMMLATMFTVKVNVDAATYPTITSGVAISMKTEEHYNKSTGNYTKNNTLYKMVLSDDSVVKFVWANNSSKKLDITIYADAAETKMVSYVDTDTTSGNYYHALKKGTYYLRMYDGYYDDIYTAKARVKLVITLATKVNKANYCRAKAISLAKGTVANVAQTPNYDYVRWYKITLTAAQVINVYTNKGMGYYVYLYDSKMDSLSCTTGNKQVTTQKKYAKGTYYIKIVACGSYGSYDRLGDFIKFKWN